MKSHSQINRQPHPRSRTMDGQRNAVFCNPKLTAIGLACLLLTLSAAQAASLPLLQRPPGNGSKPPIPNVIISVDNSDSMGQKDVVGSPGVTRLALLKASLMTQFGDGTANSGKIPDKRIRLAWQAMFHTGQTSDADTLVPGAVNSMKSFEGDHRVKFKNFVTNFKKDYGTPSLTMMRQAHNYMRTPAGTDSPWADAPGTAQTTPYLACRRTYHIFMTDGAWNTNAEDDIADSQRDYTPYSAFNTLNLLGGHKGDSTDITLPDGTSYNTASNQTRIYRDTYGDTVSTKPMTFADFAFRSWATDLQDGTDSTQNMANSVSPLINKKGPETFPTTTCTSAGNCYATPEYWNPKNDPATWQHINTFTIGFGEGAVNWGTAAEPNTPLDWDDAAALNTSRDNYGGDFAKLIQGEKVWPNVKPENLGFKDRPIELWHAALNSRAKFYPARTAEDLTAAFEAILNTVINDTSGSMVAVTTSSSFLRAGTNAYTAGYSAEQWSGQLKAYAIDASTGTVATTAAWSAGGLLDGLADPVANRFVLSSNGGTGFSWKTFSGTAPILPTAQQTPMNKDSSETVDNKGQERVDYIRGDRTKEVSKPGGIFRNRNSRLGDIVNSNIWYTGIPASGYTMNNYAGFRISHTPNPAAAPPKVGRTPMVYVGANDGMLHGFAASTNGSVQGGTELLAYIPQGIAEGNLRKLTDTTYDDNHKYFVDGTPFTGDAFIGTTPAWTTVLVGTLGRGGKGYFILNATDPADFTVANAANLVIKDTTAATTDRDIGVMTSPPTIDVAIPSKSGQIVQMNNGRWALVMGNGYNSDNEAPVLIVQYLDGVKEIVRISPCGGQTVQTTGCTFQGNGNGLSSPLLVDLNGNGKVDVAYAGDLQGNVWKFNLTSADGDSNTSPKPWAVSFGGQPFFVAKGPATLGTRTTGTVAQSITTAPYGMPHPLGGYQIGVGTGQALTSADQTSTNVASFYGLWDNSPFTVASGIVTINEASAVTSPVNTAAATVSMSKLVQQTLDATVVSDPGGTYFASTKNAVAYTTSDAGTTTPTVIAATKRGWFIDWSISGQRVLANTRPFSGKNVVIQSTIPSQGSTQTAESCNAVNASAERNFLTIVDLIGGAPPSVSPFKLATANAAVSTIEVGSDTALLHKSPTEVKIVKALPPTDPICVANPKDPRCTETTFIKGAHLGKRVSWRNEQ